MSARCVSGEPAGRQDLREPGPHAQQDGVLRLRADQGAHLCSPPPFWMQSVFDAVLVKHACVPVSETDVTSAEYLLFIGLWLTGCGLQAAMELATLGFWVFKTLNFDRRKIILTSAQVSFNGGAHWQDLTQPESFRYPECNSCQNTKGCQLHLHGPSSWHYGAGAPSSRGARCLTARYKRPPTLAPPAIFTAGRICASQQAGDGVCSNL